MRIRQIKELIKIRAEQSDPDAIMMIGPGGIGKSAIVEQVGQELGLLVQKINLQHFYPEQLIGLPKDREGWVKWLRPSVLPEERCIVFLDELTNASALKQNAAMQLIYEKQVGDHRLHPDSLIVCAGNSPDDNLLAKALPSLVVNRMTMIKAEPPTIDEWLTDFAIPNDIDPLIRAFLKARPQYLFQQPPGPTSEQQFATPRAWERLSKTLGVILKSDDVDFRQSAIIGDVGPEAGAAFAMFITAKMEVPTIDEFIEKRKMPENPDALFILVEDLITELRSFSDRKKTEQNADRFRALWEAIWEVFKDELEVFRYIITNLLNTGVLPKLYHHCSDLIQQMLKNDDLLDILVAPSNT